MNDECLSLVCGFPHIDHFIVHGEIEWDIHMWLMTVSRSETVSWESWLLVISRTGCSDSRHWPPSSTYPLSHWHRRQLYNYPVLTSSHVSSIRPLSGDLSDKSRHSHEHLPLSFLTRDLVTDGTFYLNWSLPRNNVSRGYQTGGSWSVWHHGSWVKIAGGTHQQWPAYHLVRGDINRCSWN